MSRKLAVRTFLGRMNEGRATWLEPAVLLESCKEFFEVNGYSVYNDRNFGEGNSSFKSPLVGSKDVDNSIEILATYLHPRLERNDTRLFGSIESALFSVLDNSDNTSLVLATDSFSYPQILRNQELNVAVENIMSMGLYLLFLNGRSAHAIFDKFSALTAPITVRD